MEKEERRYIFNPEDGFSAISSHDARLQEAFEEEVEDITDDIKKEPITREGKNQVFKSQDFSFEESGESFFKTEEEESQEVTKNVTVDSEDDPEEGEVVYQTQEDESNLDSEEIEEKPITDNFYRFKAKEMITRGELPEDFDIEAEDLDGNKISRAWEDLNKEKIIRTLHNAYLENLKESGFDTEHLEIAYLLKNKVSQEEIEPTYSYKEYSEMDIEDLESDEERHNYIRTAYEDKGLSTLEVQKIIDSAEADGDLDEILKLSKDYFKERFTESQQVLLLKAQQEEQRRKAEIAERNQFLQNVLTTGVLLEDQLDQEEIQILRDSIFKRDVTAVYGDKQVNVTKFESFVSNLEDFKFRLFLFKNFLLRDRENKKKILKLEKQAEDNAILAWGETSRNVKKEVHSKIEERPKNKNSIVFNTKTGFQPT